MGQGEAKLKDHFLFCIMANKEGRVNEMLTVKLIKRQLITIELSPASKCGSLKWHNKSNVQSWLPWTYEHSIVAVEVWS